MTKLTFLKSELSTVLGLIRIFCADTLTIGNTIAALQVVNIKPRLFKLKYFILLTSPSKSWSDSKIHSCHTSRC